MLQRQMEKATRQLTTHSETGVVIEGLSSPQLKLANCCLPIPGDAIIGFVSKQSGIVIHADFCPNCSQFEGNRLIEAFWSDKITRKYPTWIKVVAGNRPTMLADVVTVINASSVSIAEINALTTSNLELIIRIKISINNALALQSLMVNLRKVSELYSVERDYK